MPRRNERKPLDHSGADDVGEVFDGRLDAVGVRQVVLVSGAGRARFAQINPSSYQCRRLAAQLADQWVEMASGMSRSAVEVHRQALHGYLTFAEGAHNSNVSLDGHPSAVVTTFDAWAKSLLVKYPSTSTMPYRMTNIVQSQMAGAVADGVITNDVLSAYARGHSVVAKPESQPLDEFTEDELKRMVLAARAHIRSLEKLRQWAARTVERGAAGEITDPDRALVSRMLQAAMQGEPIARRRRPDTETLLALFPAEAWALNGPIDGSLGTIRSAVYWCLRAVFPFPIDLVPFRVLLLAGTGVSADEISALGVSDVEWAEGGVRLQMTKSRSGRSKGRFFPGASDGGGWDVPGVVRSLLAFTESARTIAPAELKDLLWLSIVRRPNDELCYLPASTDWCRNDAALKGWIRRMESIHGVGEISLPHDIRRIRKTKVTQRAIQLRGVLSDIAGDDHTTQVFFSHYGHTTTLKVYSASVVSKFQSTLAEAVKTGFTAFLQERSEVPLDALTEALPIEQSQAQSMRSGDLDMGVADCRDPFDSPFTRKGALCGSAPLSCLMCENAVVFADHLPNVMALISAMDTARQAMSPEEWIATWGTQYDAARALLSSLPDTTIESARQSAESAVTDLPAWVQRSGQ